MAHAAVITGDIVNYSRIQPDRQKKLLAQLAIALKDHKFEFYRGDSFQVFMKEPAIALRLALEVRAIARKISDIHDVRVSIGIGEMNTSVRSLGTTTGVPFVLSGRALDSLTGEERLVIRTPDERADLALRAISNFADFLVRGWTEKQAEVMVGLLHGESQEMIGKRLKKSQPTVNKHAHAGGWPEIKKLLELYNETIRQFAMI
jgi:hypothetical protein